MYLIGQSHVSTFNRSYYIEIRSYHVGYSTHFYSHITFHPVNELDVEALILQIYPLLCRIKSLLHRTKILFYPFTKHFLFPNRTIVSSIWNKSLFLSFSHENHSIFTKGTNHRSSSCKLSIFLLQINNLLLLRHRSLSRTNQIKNSWSFCYIEDY